MADRSVRVVLSAAISDFQAKMAQAKASTDKLTEAAERNIAANAKLSNHEKELARERARLAEQSKQSMNTLGDSLLKVGAVAAVGFGVAVKASADFEQAMSNVKATGQDAAVNFDALRAAAVEMGAATAFSSSEAASGIENLLKAGVSATDVLGGGLKGSLDLAAAGSMAVGEASEIAATALTQFNLSGRDVPHVADLLAAGAGKAQGEVSDLGAALKQSGLVASQFGLSIEETVGGLSAFASAGLLGSDAGTSLKSMLLRLANPSKEAAAAMAEAGIAAYDAQGNFVGLESLAGQLQTAFSGSTQAVRDQALATIFGSDAVRAANVLYKEGAAGIADWTAKVDDAGYAAEVAATKQDNLRGDLEKLGGAFDSVLIQGGSGANDALRDLAQGATSLVEAIGQVPAPVLETVVGLTGLVAAGGLAAGVLLKAYTTATDLHAAFRTLAPAGSSAAGMLGALGKAAGIAAVGMAALNAIGGEVQRNIDDMRLSAEGAEVELRAMAATGEITARMQSSWAAAMSGTNVETKDMVAGLTMLHDYTGTWQDRLETGINSLVGMKGNMAMLREEVAKFDSALVAMKPQDAAKAFEVFAEQAKLAGYSTADLTGLLPQYANMLQDAAAASGDTGAATEGLTTALAAVAAAAAEAKAKTEAYLGIISADRSQDQLIDSAIRLKDAILENVRVLPEGVDAFDRYYEAGRANRELLRELAEGYHTLTGTTGEVAEGQAFAALKFMEAAEAAGYTKEQATGLAAEFLGVTPAILALDADLAAFQTRLDSAGGTIMINGDAMNAEEALAYVIANIDASDGTVLIDGNKVPAETALQVLMGIVGSSQGDIRVGAETSVAESAINTAARDRTSTIYVTSVLSYTTASGTWDTPLPNAADGALLQRKGAGMVRSYAAGGIDQPRPVGSIGSRTNGIYPYAGPAGVIMNEAGSGPWEGIVSGHPGKRSRSRVITEEIARRLGGDVQWRFADGGFFGDGSSLPAGGGGVRQLAREIVTMLDSRPIIAQTVIDSKVVAQAVRRSDRSIR